MQQATRDLTISPATQADCRHISAILLERGVLSPQLQALRKRSLRRIVYERWVIPRFLLRSAETFRADRDGQMVGYLALLFEHPAVVVVDAVALEGFKGQSIESGLLAKAEEVARARDYPYLRAALASDDLRVATTFSDAGFAPLEFRRWEFKGEVEAQPAPQETTMRPLIGRAAMERRAHYLRVELDAAQPVGGPLIEALYVPKRPSTAQAFEIVHQGEPIGYLSARREGGSYVLGLSTDPRWWGDELEGQLVASFVTSAARADKGPLHLRMDSSPHVERAAGMLSPLGLQKVLVDPEIWFKSLPRES